MAWRIEVAGRARKQLAAIEVAQARRIIAFLRDRVARSDDPRHLGEPLKGSRLGGLWRYRVGDYRVIVDIQDDVLRPLVVQIGHRREVYR